MNTGTIKAYPRLVAAVTIAVIVALSINVSQAQAPSDPITEPALRIPDNIGVAPLYPVDIPVLFDSGGQDISAVAFSLDYDEQCLAFDPTDANGDGNADSIKIDLPSEFGFVMVMADNMDTDGEIDIVMADVQPPLAVLPDGTLIVITFDTICAPPVGLNGVILAAVNFSQSPNPSFSDSRAFDLQRSAQDGAVNIPGLNLWGLSALAVVLGVLSVHLAKNQRTRRSE